MGRDCPGWPRATGLANKKRQAFRSRRPTPQEMDMKTTPEKIDHSRRSLLAAATMTAAAAPLGMLLPASAETAKPVPVKPGTNVSFGPLKNIDAGLLNVAYAEAGPANGPPVILLHGWPYDIHSYVDVAPLLASAGYRVIVIQGGIGHNLPQEAPRAFADAVVEVDRF